MAVQGSARMYSRQHPVEVLLTSVQFGEDNNERRAWFIVDRWGEASVDYTFIRSVDEWLISEIGFARTILGNLRFAAKEDLRQRSTLTMMSEVEDGEVSEEYHAADGPLEDDDVRM